jgi:hypothetical protein
VALAVLGLRATEGKRANGLLHFGSSFPAVSRLRLEHDANLCSHLDRPGGGDRGEVRVIVIGIDAALRKTGLCLLAGPLTRLATVEYSKPLHRDGLLDVALAAVRDLCGDVIPDLGAVEFPPPSVTKRKDKGGSSTGPWPAHVLARMPAQQREALERSHGAAFRTTESAVLAWAAAMFTAAIRGHGCPDVVSVEVMTWREVILGDLGRGGGPAAKRAAIWVANDYLRRHGLDPVANDHQAEALAIALWRERTARHDERCAR